MPLTKKKVTTSKTYKPRKTKGDQDIRRFMTPSFRKAVKSVVWRSAETKEAMSTSGNGGTSVSLFHNVSKRLTGNLMITKQGVSDNPGGVAGAIEPDNLVRIGDEIQPLNMKIYMAFRQPSDRPNVTVRVYVLKFPGQIVPPTFVPFKAVTLYNFLNPIDTEKCKVVKIKTYKLPSDYWTGTAAESKEACFFRTINLNFPKTKYRYSGDDLTNGQSYNLALYACAFDTFGTLITDNIMTMSYNAVLKFKDM